MCPLSPFTLNSDPDEDVGWAELSQAPEGRSAVAAAGDVVDDVVDCEEDVEVRYPEVCRSRHSQVLKRSLATT